jgi:hypothetical protein
MKIAIREKQKGDEIISTPHNTDARYVKKGKQKIKKNKNVNFYLFLGVISSTFPQII